MYESRKPEPKEPSRIILYEDSELSYWTKELGISEGKLKELVARVGALPSKVREAVRRDH